MKTGNMNISPIDSDTNKFRQRLPSREKLCACSHTFPIILLDAYHVPVPADALDAIAFERTLNRRLRMALGVVLFNTVRVTSSRFPCDQSILNGPAIVSFR
jgi:hypothetical protein